MTRVPGSSGCLKNMDPSGTRKKCLREKKKSMEKAERGKFCSVIESTGRWGMKAK